MLKKKYLFSFLIILLLGNNLFYSSVLAAGHFSVIVDVKRQAENAWKAKDCALLDAEKEGVALLVDKLFFSRDKERAYQVIIDRLPNVLSFMEIKDQAFFNQNFRANVHCYYTQDVILRVLEEEKIAFTLQNPQNVLLIIESDIPNWRKGEIAMLWQKQSNPHVLTFHTGFNELQDSIAWKAYKKNQDVGLLFSYFKKEYPKHMVIFIKYTNDLGRSLASFYVLSRSQMLKIMEMDIQGVQESMRMQVEFLNDWWKGFYYAQPWETSQVSLCHDIKNAQDWFAFVQSIKERPFVRDVSVESIAFDKGCVVARFSKCYKKSIIDEKIYS